MGAAAAFTDEFVLKSCLGESTLRECAGRKRDNVVLIEIDTDDFGEVIILDVPESFREKFRKKPKHVISLDDDDDDDDSIDNRDGSCNTNNDVTTSDRCHSTHGARPSTSASVEEKDVIEGNTPVRLSKSKRTYSGKNISRNKYGLSPDSEGCSSESDCSDCELMEGSLEKLREQWEKASLRRRHDATCVCPEVGNTAGTSGPSHPVYDYAEEGTSEESEPLGQQNGVRECSPHDDGDNDFAGFPQTSCQDTSEQHYDPMEVDGQSPRACDNFMSSGRDDKAKGGALASECSLHYSSEKCVDRHMEPLGDLNDSAQKLGEQFKFPGQNCDSKIPNEVCSRDYSADLIKKPSQVAESNHAALFDRQGAGIPSMPSELKSKCGHLNEGLCSSGENGIITDRQKIKETELFKHAQEEELAARQEQLLRQADEAQRLRARKRAEKMRLMMNEKRQQQRVEEIRQSRRKDEENLNLKEKHRVEIKKELRMIESMCIDMASLLRRLGIHVGGGMLPSPNEVQAAYKQACLKFHPDRISTTDLRQQVEAEEKFKLISNMKDKFLSKR